MPEKWVYSVCFTWELFGSATTIGVPLSVVSVIAGSIGMSCNKSMPIVQQTRTYIWAVESICDVIQFILLDMELMLSATFPHVTLLQRCYVLQIIHLEEVPKQVLGNNLYFLTFAFPSHCMIAADPPTILWTQTVLFASASRQWDTSNPNTLLEGSLSSILYVLK
jgi:hypothetical protein